MPSTRALERQTSVTGDLQARGDPRPPPLSQQSAHSPHSRPRGRRMEDHDARDGVGDAAAGRTNGGAHGYDPTLKSMHGLFVAAGPRVREGVRAPAFENIHIYNFLCALLGLKPSPNDGDPSVTSVSSAMNSQLNPNASPQSLEVLQGQHVTVTGSYAAAAQGRSRPGLGEAPPQGWRDGQPVESPPETASGRPRADFRRAARARSHRGVLRARRAQQPAGDGDPQRARSRGRARSCSPADRPKRSPSWFRSCRQTMRRR